MITSFAQDIYQMLCQKYPNQNIYVIGDQHFFHSNIIQYTRNQFSDVLEMNQYIIQKHNAVVQKEDIVILLGDFCFKNDYMKDALSQMNGHKYFILGNHDSVDLIKRYPNLGLEGVFLNPIKIENAYLSHEPLMHDQRSDLQFQLIVNEFQKYADKVNYHGHIHYDDAPSSRYQNATCEVLNYQPICIGKTKEQNNKDVPLFINSPYFDAIVTEIATKHHIQPQLLLSDYLYATVLETPILDHYLIQGSYGLLKKYNFLSKMSDLDIAFLYNPSISKKKHYEQFKKSMDSVFENLKAIDGINLRFIKRYVSLRILETLYTSKTPYFASCIVDANLITFDSYRKTDFMTLKESSLIQKYLQRKHSSMIQEYHFPEFTSQFLTPEGDIANLLLQIFYQQGFEDKKIEALKRMKYVYKTVFADKPMHAFSDIFIRFFLKNIAFLHTTCRFDEIEHIQNQVPDFTLFQNTMPADFNEQIHEINHPYSDFMEVRDAIASTHINQVYEKCKELVKK